MSRHAVKQLPRTGHGDALCKHTAPGNCTWWCSYGRFVKVCLALAVVIGGFGSISFFFDETDGVGRLVNAGLALVIYLVIVLALISVANRRDGGDHY